MGSAMGVCSRSFGVVCRCSDDGYRDWLRFAYGVPAFLGAAESVNWPAAMRIVAPRCRLYERSLGTAFSLAEPVSGTHRAIRHSRDVGVAGDGDGHS